MRLNVLLFVAALLAGVLMLFYAYKLGGALREVLPQH